MRLSAHPNNRQSAGTLQAHIKIGSIRGIEIGLHYTWTVIAILIAFSLAAHFRGVNRGWTSALTWFTAGITAVLFFVTLLLHELAHSLVAKAYGLRVKAITLFALGGVSQIESEATTAKAEFWIAIVGPVTSAVTGAILLLVARAAGWHAGTKSSMAWTAVLVWLGYINFALAGFNMIPGYPLDGGRILRAALWWITGSQRRATRWASQAGQGVALVLILFGLFRFFVGAGVAGLWIAFIGWFLLDAARAGYIQFGVMTELRDRTVADLMERNCPVVEGYLSLRDLVDEFVLHSASRCFLVVHGGHPVGVITPDEIAMTPRDSWEQNSVQSAMRRLNQIPAVPPQMPALEALELMGREKLTALIVVLDGHLQGVFSHGQVMRFLQIRPGDGFPRQRAA